jgi:hypothetical protein
MTNTPWIQSTRNLFDMAEEEMNRLEALPVQGEQSIMVQRDMKVWAVENGLWAGSEPYKRIVQSHAKARGWMQDGFTGMEIVD